MRQVLITLCLLFAAQATGLMRATTVCAEQCDDDDDEGRCAPNCACCSCCSHAPTAIPLRAMAASPACLVGHESFSSPPAAFSSPDPRDILHVPRSA